MKNYFVKRYQDNDYENWNAFIGQAKNATFLFHRDFMEYHKDRFLDYSLIVLDGEKWVAVLPANLVGNEVFSHQGLTYGGLVYNEKVKLASIIEIFKSILSFLNENKMEKLQLKLIPSIYHQKPAEELNYALFLAEAQLIRRDSMAVLDLSKPYTISKTRKECIRRGKRNNLIIKEELNFKLFWEEVLEPNLDKKYQAKPVHTIAEIEMLQRKFPNNIRHFNVYQDDKIVAGTTVFISENVAHPQYISGMDNKNELGSLDFLYHYLIANVFKDKRFFDFGISNEEQGKKLNEGLVFWKESFGASVIVHDFYEVKTSNYGLLDTVLI
ncbi:GNAT family N-acetyltransferase [Flavobacterium sp.]|uniref:GNAT family N-acetyltransferase n=1 Tax=Flavobacterium sp. TaxID=239 RepID=UPI0025B98D2A|nr:GNAT family N-acetyltransferase [Flavobacterium sp.]MBA4276636.1 GNAT family N-acetyltransferase [Flavobacterium sp.]